MNFNRKIALAGLKMVWALVLELTNLLALLAFSPMKRGTTFDAAIKENPEENGFLRALTDMSHPDYFRRKSSAANPDYQPPGHPLDENTANRSVWRVDGRNGFFHGD